jgi:hypothetical protein
MNDPRLDVAETVYRFADGIDQADEPAESRSNGGST